jgi:hypothetical protein
MEVFSLSSYLIVSLLSLAFLIVVSVVNKSGRDKGWISSFISAIIVSLLWPVALVIGIVVTIKFSSKLGELK